MKSVLVRLFFCWLSLLSCLASAEQVTIAVASNFAVPMKQIATEFEQEFDHKVIIAFGSSGKFFAQINHGAPFQVFLSADQAKPMALEASGLAVVGSRFTYAQGALVLWSSIPGFIDADASVLKQQRFRKLSLANPKLAPYGVAAVEVLKSLALMEATQEQWVLGENVSQTYQFVDTGNADLGLIALSQVMKDNKIASGSYWIVPSDLYQPIRQDAVLLTKGASSAAAKSLLKFLQSNKVKAIIEPYGYTRD